MSLREGAPVDPAGKDWEDVWNVFRRLPARFHSELEGIGVDTLLWADLKEYSGVQLDPVVRPILGGGGVSEGVRVNPPV